MTEVSANFPINVLARLLDVPPKDNQQLIDWGNRIIGNTDPDYADVLLHSTESEKYRDQPFRSPASLEVFAYGRALARRRRGGGPGLRTGQHHPARRSPALRAGLRQLLPAPGGGRQRDHPAHHHPLGAGPPPAPQAAGPAQGRPVADPDGGGGVPALAPRLPLPPYRHPPRRARRQADQGGRQGRHVVRLRQPGRGGLRRPVRLRRGPAEQRPRHLRQGQPAPVPGQPAPARRHHVRGADPPAGRHPTGGRSPAGALHRRRRDQEAAGRGHPRLSAGVSVLPPSRRRS